MVALSNLYVERSALWLRLAFQFQKVGLQVDDALDTVVVSDPADVSADKVLLGPDVEDDLREQGRTQDIVQLHGGCDRNRGRQRAERDAI